MFIIVAAGSPRIHSTPYRHFRQDQGQARRRGCWFVFAQDSLSCIFGGGANECVFAAKPREEITISMPNGKEEKGTAWETTPGAIARGISKSLFERTVISMVDGELWDLTRPLEKSCKLELIDFEHEEGTL